MRWAAGLLAVGLQAQLRDARVSSGGAADDGAAVRVEGSRLVRDCAMVFGLSADDVFGGHQVRKLCNRACFCPVLQLASRLLDAY